MLQMIGAGPYRSLPYSSYEENELWLRLDEALEKAIRYPVWAYSIAWNVYNDSHRYPTVHRAACELMQRLY
jgi:hypothetical protein